MQQAKMVLARTLFDASLLFLLSFSLFFYFCRRTVLPLFLFLLTHSSSLFVLLSGEYEKREQDSSLPQKIRQCAKREKGHALPEYVFARFVPCLPLRRSCKQSSFLAVHSRLQQQQQKQQEKRLIKRATASSRTEKMRSRQTRVGGIPR